MMITLLGLCVEIVLLLQKFNKDYNEYVILKIFRSLKFLFFAYLLKIIYRRPCRCRYLLPIGVKSYNLYERSSIPGRLPVKRRIEYIRPINTHLFIKRVNLRERGRSGVLIYNSTL